MQILVQVNDKRRQSSEETSRRKTFNCIVNVDSEAPVENICEQLSAKTGIPANCFKVIFGGKLLTNNATVGSLLLGPQTALTALVTDVVVVDSVGGSNPSGHETDSPKYPLSFQVYCKLCSSVKQGKLRVCCVDCGSNSVLLKRDPVGWDDVLLSSRISADCQECNKESFVRFYFKCVDCSEISVPLTHCRGKGDDTDCCICGEKIPDVIVDFGCHHYICMECFVAYMKTCFKQRRFVLKKLYGYTLPCPIYQCSGCVSDPHHFYLLGREDYELYKEQAAEKFVSLQEGGVFCPNDKCGEAFIISETAPEGKALCPYCTCYFCPECRLESCICRKNDETFAVIQKISKKCPRCGVHTERNGGCTHMQCTNCGADWCFLCVKPWNEDCQWNHWFD